MTTAALDFTYKYAFPSAVGETQSGFGLRLATCGAKQQQPHFFDGKLLAPREMGEMLLVLSNVVRTHFFLPRPALLDPVVTTNEAVIRFEGFSGCCGVYARVDLPAEAFQSDHLGRGTTNVDFNDPMRAALSRLRDHDDARLAVGADGVELSKNNETVVEKKVRLPIRWIKGFSEVQLYQPAMQIKLESSGNEARQFVRSLPRAGAPKRPSYVTQTGKALRLSQRASKGAVKFLGTHRVRVLEPLMNTAKTLRVWADEDSGSTAWEVILRAGRFFLMLSPEVYRGFSGEGQALEKLAGHDWQDALSQVQDQLKWQAQLDVDDIAGETGLAEKQVNAALAVLGSRGLAGYDAGREAYFHRELPFDLAQVEELQPRLKAARKLLDGAGVRVLQQAVADEQDVEVDGTDVKHLVRLRPSGDKCSCPWFSKHLGQRGPCKHILAARIFTDDDESLE
ncbi:MAG: SWIM zinc finger family protein [Planctomycetota bacterium]|nr:MAG: SWIM zinc finger family protein [Planctomycetota bacterium]REJ86943.1 MAG: SWIM zinc finger family protein [Planctomycetota bacterium]REK24930.1 MAG: SWIM zinc finger family protein [Planctomycetota bacterium]REK48519.1 MAG: SWIM zinc finger family protein [Planctomycetota bacterium]